MPSTVEISKISMCGKGGGRSYRTPASARTRAHRLAPLADEEQAPEEQPQRRLMFVFLLSAFLLQHSAMQRWPPPHGLRTTAVQNSENDLVVQMPPKRGPRRPPPTRLWTTKVQLVTPEGPHSPCKNAPGMSAERHGSATERASETPCAQRRLGITGCELGCGMRRQAWRKGARAPALTSHIARATACAQLAWAATWPNQCHDTREILWWLCFRNPRKQLRNCPKERAEARYWSASGGGAQ